MTEVFTNSASISVPVITTTASAIVTKHFSGFAVISFAADTCSSRFDVFDTISSGQISGFTVITVIISAGGMNSFAVAPAVVCSVRFVW